MNKFINRFFTFLSRKKKSKDDFLSFLQYPESSGFLKNHPILKYGSNTVSGDISSLPPHLCSTLPLKELQS